MRTDDLRPMNDEPDLPEADEKSDIWEDDPDAPPTPQERGWDEEVDPDAEDRPAPKDDPSLMTDAGAEAALEQFIGQPITQA